MATAMIILEDVGPDGEVNIRLRFEPNGADEDSSAHALAAHLLEAAAALHEPTEEEGL